MEKQIEALAIKLLNNIEKHTSLCENDYERNIFLQGVNEGYNAACKEVQRYKEALEKIANEPFRYRWEGSPKQTPKQIAQAAISKAEDKWEVNNCDGCMAAMPLVGIYHKNE